MLVRRIHPGEYKRCQELWAVCFEYRMKRSDWTAEALVQEVRANPQSRQEAHWDNLWAAFDGDGGMMSAMAVIPWEARFDGHTVRMDGVGGVVTLPEYRRRGGIRGCFEAALPAMYREGALLSYLYPFSTAFYGRFGYAPGCEWTLWKLALAGIPREEVPGRYTAVARGRSVGRDLRAVDAVRQARYNLMTVDGELEYRWAQSANPGAQREYSYVYYGASGAPKGYVTWVPAEDAGDRVLDVKRFAYADREGLQGLLSLLRGLAADHSHALLRLPCDARLEGLLPEWSLGVVQRTVECRGMVRAVNAEALLRLARPRGVGTLKVALEDAQIPGNNGCFRVEFGAGESDVRRTDEAPDVRMDIRAFGRAICGLEDGLDPEWQPGVELLCDPAEAGKLFYRKPCYIEQYF